MFHQAFATIDWIVLAAYLVVVILIGIVSHSVSDGVRDFFFARGRMPWWAVGTSLIATSVSASTFLGNPAEAYQFDLRLLQLNIGVPVSILIVCLVFIPYFRRSNASSAYEVLENRFDLKTRMLASTFYIMHLLLRTGILILGPAILFSQLTGVNVRITIAAVGVVAVGYTALGGIRAVIWTDVLQFLILFGGGALICWFIAQDVPGGSSSIFSAAGRAGKLTWFDGSWDLADPRNIWAAGAAYIALDLAIRSTDQQFVQRYLSCDNVRHTQYAAILSAVLGTLVAILFFVVGIYLWGFYREFPAELAQGNGANEILPHYITTKLPWGLSGLIVAAVFAAAMSSVDSAVSALSNTATVDFFERFGGSKLKSLTFARCITILWGVLGIGFGLYAATIGKNLFILALSFTSLFTGALLGIFILAVATKRANGWGATLGAIAGMTTLGIGTKVLDWEISWPWYPVISMGTTIAVGMATSLITNRHPQRASQPTRPSRPCRS